MKPFIKTTDEKTANMLISYGFKLVSKMSNIYTFLNETPKNFNFESIDQKNIVFDNKLSL